MQRDLGAALAPATSPGDASSSPAVTDDPGSAAPDRSDADQPAGSDRAPRIPHLRALDGLRGVAVLAVVVYHFAPDVAPGGFLGVDMFFVLSGFLITSLLVAERESTGHTALREFWVRRARRLFPALFLVLLAVGAWSVLKATPLEHDRLRDDGFAAIGYFANWRFISSGQSYIEQFVGIGPSPLRHTWSLAIEEQFYLVWPLFVAGLGVVLIARARRSGRPMAPLRPVLVALCLVLALVSVVLMALLHHAGDDPSRVYYGTDTRAHLLLIGAALGAASAGMLSVGARRRGLLVGAGIVASVLLIAAMLTTHADHTWLYEAGYLGISIAVALVIAAAAQPGFNPLARILRTRPLVGLGLISYGVYLWHWPIVVWFDPARTGLDGAALFALRAVLTLGVSLASYFLVEMPIRRGVLRRINPMLPRILAPAAVMLAVLVLVLPSIGVARVDGTVDRPVAAGVDLEPVTRAYEGVPRCDAAQPDAVPAATEGLTIDLYGNSFAQEVFPCLERILDGYGVTLGGSTQPAAALCDFQPILRGRVATDPPDGVILYTLPVAYTPCAQNLKGAALNELWKRDTLRAVTVLRDAGVDVYLVAPVPKVGEAGESPLAPYYRRLASRDPEHVRVLDAGTYLRDDSGTSQWVMPCVRDGEAGCRDDAVDVRHPLDGTHMCADAAWRAGICEAPFAAGERRAAAAIGAQLLLDLVDADRPST
jgi:peptidoglycan/LPS O-acetylase OafA/YrhL